jgi:hypothetical protein
MTRSVANPGTAPTAATPRPLVALLVSNGGEGSSRRPKLPARREPRPQRAWNGWPENRAPSPGLRAEEKGRGGGTRTPSGFSRTEEGTGAYGAELLLELLDCPQMRPCSALTL